MDIATLSQKGLLKELASIPAGQIFILTNPHLGITSDNITHIQGIFSIAKSVKKREDVIVNALPGEWSELMGCYACKVGDEIMLADNASLVEMLCEFWGLDYDEVCKTITIAGRNSGGKKAITFGGDTHPMRLSVPAKSPETSLKEPDFGISLGYYTTHTRESLLGDIRSILQDNFRQELGISASDLIKIYEEEQNRKRPTWHLDIKLGKGNTGYNKNWELVEKVKCEINLVDPDGTPHFLDIKAQNLALYLTFILFKDGIKLSEIQNVEFYSIFITMCERLPYVNNKPKDGKTLMKYAGDKRNQILRQITDIIKEDQYLIKQFAIEGYKGEPYKVAASTDEQREAIKKAFGIE